jgi:HK97 family phage major capsid protein
MKKEIMAVLDKKFKKVESKLAEAQKNGASKASLEKIIKSMKKQGKAMQRLEASMKEDFVESVASQYEDHLIENADKLAQIMKAKTGVMEFIPKVVGDMSNASGSDAAAFPVNSHTNLGHFNFRNDSPLLALCSVTSTSTATHPYTELTPKDGDYAFVAEAVTKPQVDFLWINRFAEPKKIAAYEVLSEEVSQDIKRMVSVAKEYLRKKHDLFKVNGIYFGPGTAGTIEGATVLARTFVAGDMALAVVKPNFMDTLNAIITDIYVTQNYVDESPYEANVSLVNPVDFYIELVSAKDDNGLPLYPQASLFNQVTIGGVMIKPWIKVPAGKIFVADMKRFNVSNYIPFSIRTGWINEQLIDNQFTLVGESRFFGYVKELDKQAFVYDDIATVKAAITAV